MKGTFHAASRRQRSKSSPIVIGVAVREINLKIDGSHPEPVNDKKDERTECQTVQPAADVGPSTRGILQNLRVQKPIGLTPGIRRMDPQDTRIGPPMCGDRTPEGQGHRTRHPGRGQGLRKTKDFTESRTFVGFGTSWDSRLRGTRDFMGFKTSRDIGLRGIQDFMEPRTLWDLGLCRKQELYTPQTRILFCGVL